MCQLLIPVFTNTNPFLTNSAQASMIKLLSIRFIIVEGNDGHNCFEAIRPVTSFGQPVRWRQLANAVYLINSKESVMTSIEECRVLDQLERAVVFRSPGDRCFLLHFIYVSTAFSQSFLQKHNQRLEVWTVRCKRAEEANNVFKCCVIHKKLIVFVDSCRLGRPRRLAGMILCPFLEILAPMKMTHLTKKTHLDSWMSTFASYFL